MSELGVGEQTALFNRAMLTGGALNFLFGVGLGKYFNSARKDWFKLQRVNQSGWVFHIQIDPRREDFLFGFCGKMQVRSTAIICSLEHLEILDN